MPENVPSSARVARKLYGVTSQLRVASVYRHLRGHLPALVLCSIILVVFVARLRTAGSESLLTADGANYLYSMQQVFGRSFEGVGVLRPPLIAMPLKLAALVVGPLRAVRVVGLTISVGVGIPFYLLARRVSSPLVASLTAGLFVLTPEYSSTLAWGYITMFGIFFSLFAFYFLLQAIDNPHWCNIFLSGLMASLIVGFHQVSVVLFLLIVLPFGILLLLSESKDVGRLVFPLFASALVAAILAMPYLPSYLDQARQVEGGSEVLQILPDGARGVSALVTRLVHYYHPTYLWLLAFPAVAVGLCTMHRREGRSQLLIVSALVVTLGLGASRSITTANRAMYFSFIPAWLLFAAGVSWVVDRVLITSSWYSERGTAE